MNRSSALFFLLALLGVLTMAPGCPSNTGDDDDDSVDDDDDDDDDDGADPCDSVTDITATLDGTPTTGATSSSDDDTLAGSCSGDSPGASEAIFSITPATSGLVVVSTSNGLTDFDTVLYVLTDCGDIGSEVACNDDVSQDDTTSTLQFEATADTTYYVVIDGYEASGGFELTVELAICGDNNVSGTEQCDDGGTEPGDGCDENCEWECVDDGNEDDDSPETATSLNGETFPTTYADGVLCPSDLNEDIGVYGDFWAVDVAEGEYLSIAVAGGAALSTTCADQTLTGLILDTDFNAYGGGDTTEGECVAGAFEPDTAGTYYVAVFGDDQTVAPQDYSLTVDVGVSVCGDGALEGIEECDDNNTDSGDGCSPTCVEEDATCTPIGAAEANVGGAALTGDTSTGTDDHQPGTCGLAGGSAEDVYTFTVTEDTTIIASLDNAGTLYDTTMYVRENCVDPGSEVACNDDGPEGLSSVLFFDAVKDVTYYIFIDGYDADQGAYELSLTAPVCGDAVVDLNEDCDDMNSTPGDGCENDCTATPVCDYTVDEALGTLPSGDTTHQVDLSAATDDLPDIPCSDVGGGDTLLSFELATGGDVTFAYTQVGDAQFAVFSADGDCEAGLCEDPGGADTAGTVTLTGAAAGVHYLLVEAWVAGEEGTIDFTITAP